MMMEIVVKMSNYLMIQKNCLHYEKYYSLFWYFYFKFKYALDIARHFEMHLYSCPLSIMKRVC